MVYFAKGRALWSDRCRDMRLEVRCQALATTVPDPCLCCLQDGQIVQQGTHAELMADPKGAYAGLVQHQHGH